MRPARQFDGYLRPIDGSIFEKLSMSTSDRISDEIFASLDYFSEIEAAGHDLFRAHGQTRSLTKNYTYFQSFIRQAKSFYKSGLTLEYRASPLIYYYAFLNLAKAFVALKQPQSIRGNVYHGLQRSRGNSKLARESVDVARGVFPIFYELLIGQPLPIGTRLNCFDMLGYCSDVGLEYSLGRFGDHRLMPTRYRVATVGQNREAHGVVAINNFQRLEPFKKSTTSFFSIFEEVDLQEQARRALFDIYAEENRHHRYFETKRTFPSIQNNEVPIGAIDFHVYGGLKLFIEPSPYESEANCTLCPPLRANFQLPMREIIAIYAAMFYLGSLVRYDPSYLEHFFQSREAWIIERFVQTSPVTFLRMIRNLIHGRNFVYKVR